MKCSSKTNSYTPDGMQQLFIFPIIKEMYFSNYLFEFCVSTVTHKSNVYDKIGFWYLILMLTPKITNNWLSLQSLTSFW